MPPRKNADAHRALELLEEYHAQLKDSNDKPLRTAIERIIRIFRSRLFQALLDIQDFYDATLMDDDKASRTKTQEALAMAMRWEKQSPMPGSDRNKSSSGSTSTADSAALTNGREDDAPPVPPPPATEEDEPAQVRKQSIEHADRADPADFQVTEVQPSSPVEEEFEETVIVLNKKPGKGLGFSIAGGIDNQHRPNDNRVYCTKVLPNGVAKEDGRLRADDIILQVNDTVLELVKHSDAVQALKDSTNTVVLRIRRPRGGVASPGHDSPDHVAVAVVSSPEQKSPAGVSPVPVMSPGRQTPPSRVKVIVLEKGSRGLGFSIAGGIGNQHVEGDNGIYVTKVIPGGVAEVEGSLLANDKLLKVNDTALHDVTHAEAVQSLQRASGTTYLTVEKPDGDPLNFVAPSSPGVASPARQPGSPGHPSDARKVTLQKGDKGLGFNIVGGEGGEGIYISFILAGGVADLSGQLKRGDQILEVNSTNLTDASHESAAQALKGSGKTVGLVVAYRPEEYGRFEQRLQELREKASQNAAGAARTSPTKQRSSHVRALFDYDKNVDIGCGQGEGLSFRHGDILYLLNAGEGEWWTARRVNPETGEPEGQTGAVPSRKRVEKKERQKNKGKKFRGGGGSSTAGDDKTDPAPSSGSGVKRKRSFIFSKRLPFFKKQEKENKKAEGDGEEPVLSYEDVRMEEINYKRPIVILGPLKDRINDDLIQEFPEKFGSCVPHTTRNRRDYEVDGRDYHFVESREQMERDIQNHLFIEAGQYNDNLYGTSVAAVKEVAINEQKHCVLDVSGYAIRRLQVASLQPIAIFLKPGSADAILNQARRIKPEQAQKTYERALKLGEEFAEYFTAIVEPGSPEDMYANVKRVVRQHGNNRIWVPTRER
eukprot:scpid36247/ scgid29339/ Disks large homolog 2; Postsynaptic density protein 93